MKYLNRDATDKSILCVIVMLILLCIGFLIYKIVYEATKTVPKDQDSLQENYSRFRFPYVATIKLKNFTNILCLGAILSQDYIITLAKCVFDKNPDDIEVNVGRFFLANETGQKIGAKKLIIFPHYKIIQSIDYNIALIHLNNSLKYDDSVCKVFTSKYKIPEGLAIINGWGFFLNRPLRNANAMMSTTINIPNEHCNHGTICKRHLEPEFTKQKYCIGNKGSPVVQEIFPRQILLGLVIDVGYPCIRNNRQNQMISVGYFQKWIEKYVRNIH